MTKIDKFEKEYFFLSNFYNHSIEENGIIYPTNEHYFQAMKTLDISERKKIASALTPGEAKRLGRFVNLRADWEKVKFEVMEKGLHLKFADPKLAKKLIETYPAELIEGTWWHDQIWGDCYCEKHKDIPGQNNLGKLLMKIRAGLILEHYKEKYDN